MAVFFALPLAAQSGDGVKVRPLPAAVSAQPFSAAPGTATSTYSLQIISVNEMQPADHALADQTRPQIFARLRAEAFPGSDNGWTVQQIACPALPGHLLLRYGRHDGVGDTSQFSASILRNEEGSGHILHVHILPIERRGYLTFTPAAVNDVTVAVFNRIRREEPTLSQDWLGLALCYATLAGKNPLAAAAEPFPASTASLQTLPGGGAVVRFTDHVEQPGAMDWELTFDAKGALVNAVHQPTERASNHRLLPVHLARQHAPSSCPQELRAASLPPAREVPAPEPLPTHEITGSAILSPRAVPEN